MKKLNIHEKKAAEEVNSAYIEFADRLENWPNKYNISRQISKWLSDYALLLTIDLKGAKVLNIGCSEPDDELYFIHLVDEWHSIDINESIIIKSRELCNELLAEKFASKLKFTVSDVTALHLENESYDVVTSFSSIDHIPGQENRIKAINEMCRVLKPGGHLIVTVPNRWNLIYSYRSNKAQRDGKHKSGYEYQFSPLELRKLITSNGLKIIDCASTGFNPYSLFDRGLRKFGLHKLRIYMGTRFGVIAKK